MPKNTTHKITYIIIGCYPDKGMKSYGSKSLMVFSNKKLLEHQIETIRKSHSNKDNYEIVVICDFDIQKVTKYFPKIKIIKLNDTNPIYQGCLLARYDNVCFIDYGCVFEPSSIQYKEEVSKILCTKNNKNNKLEIGCVSEKNIVKHMFFDLPDHKFCNIFFLCQEDKKHILNNKDCSRHNLLYFEILNTLISSGVSIKISDIDTNKFIFFNNMRQKNAINRFIKTNL